MARYRQRKRQPHDLLSAVLTSVAMGVGPLALLGEYGFAKSLFPLAWLHSAQFVAALLLWVALLISVFRHRPFTWRLLIFDGVLLAVLASAVWLVHRKGVGELSWLLFQVYLLILLLVRFGRLTVRTVATGRGPMRMLLSSFACLILIGAALLSLPACNRGGESLAVTDAVFTATSAACVTGLVVRDTGHDFTRLGQGIILLLIQVGGLGIMIFGTLFALLMGRSLSMRESVAMRDIMEEVAPSRITSLVVFVCLSTFVIELVGMLAMSGMWESDPVTGGKWFKSLFHSVSAFCNAGFSLQSDSLCGYRFRWGTYLVMCPLIILGGLGYPVLNNGYEWLRTRLRSGKGSRLETPVYRFSLHTRIVVVTTVSLLLCSTALLVVLEGTRPAGSASGSSLGMWLDGFFNAVTARTAGFNTVEIADRSAGAKLSLILLMCIGGSPGSTAGGIKTATLAVMVLAVVATMRRSRYITVFGRSIPIMIVRRAATLMLLYMALLWLVTLLLTITEHSRGSDMLDLLFEAASALGTVGLSTGVTGELTLAGKWVIIAAMFAGRLGPLSLLTALSFNTRPEPYEYPLENVVVG